MKRPSYRVAVQWIADNDGAGDDERLDVEYVSEMVTVALVADLFGVDTARVAQDVVKQRAG